MAPRKASQKVIAELERVSKEGAKNEMKYRVNVWCIDYRQVDIESDASLNDDELRQAVKRQADREFGESDDVTIIHVENL
jgi:hypothetical protein